MNNAGFEYYQNAKKDGIGLPPHNPRIWVFRHQSNASCAPMLRRVWHPIGYSSNSGWSNFFINITAGRLLTYTNTLLKFALPDIVIGTGGGYNTYDIYESVNHELSHASHFNKVGSAFWAKYVNYIITYGKKYDHPYGDASCNNSGFVELVKCGDMRWDIFELTKNINKNPKMVKVNGSNQIYYMIS